MPAPHFETFNVYLAAFLRCKGATLVGFERVGKRRVLYRLAADEKLHDLVRLYWSETPAAVVPLGLFGSLRRLKCLVRRRPGASDDGSDAPPTPAAFPLEAEIDQSSDSSPVHPCPPSAC